MNHPRLPTLLLLAGLVLGAAAPALVGQDEESGETAIERALRDQTRVGLRLKSLRDKMERLAQRYDDEGRTRNATLLREALTALDEQKLLELADQVELSLEQSNLSTVEQQDALSVGLESIYALLRDRRDADELERQADLARQGLAELGILAENERRLLSATRATSDRESDLTQQALDQASQLDRALQSAQSATRSLQAADQALGEAALAEQLAAQQRALAAEAQPTAAIQKLLEEALAMLREKLDQPVEAAGLGDELLAAAEQSRGEAQASAAQAAGRMAAAREQLAQAEAQAQSGAEAKPGDESGEPGGESGEPGGDKSGDTSGDKSGGESGGESGEKPGEAPGEQGGSESGGQPKPSEPGAPKSPEAAAKEAKLQAAKAEMEQAAQALDEVSEALDRSERSLMAARNRAQAAALASSQQAEAAGQTMEELAERLEAVAPEDGPELLDRTRKLLEELSRAAEAQRNDAPQDAASAQSAAQLSLTDLLAMLQQRNQTADDSQSQPPTPEALEELAQRQDELQRRMRELMQRLQELPDQAFQEPGAKADTAMSGASTGLRSGDTPQAGRKEQEAAEQLEQAAKTLSGAADDYEQLRQDELLFRVSEELKGLLDRQEKVSTETREIDAAAAGAERLSRSQRRTVVRLSDEEKDLASRSESVRVTLEEDGALAFAFALRRCRDDLSSAAELLSDEQTGEFVQTIQADVSRQLQDLLAVLDAEVERRRDAEQAELPPGTPQPSGPPPLVPKVAELLLIQRMEQAALARLDNFIRLNPVDQVDGLGPVEQRLLERWSLEHLKVTELFESMVPKAGANPQMDADGQDKEQDQ